MQLNKLIKREARKLNIDICRITDGSELKKEKAILKNRKKKGYWPQPLTNQNIKELTEPALHFSNLNSIIVVALSYNNGGGTKILSNYVSKEDYHNFLKDKMEALTAVLKEKIDEDFSYKLFVDTAPFLERAIAEKAGAGFIGKNTMLINPEYGSYLFLGEIFTDLKIEKDSPLNLDCGECRICIDNCEGGALKDEYLLDASDCISYLTQKKGILTENEIYKIGSHVWGCDACQLKCPYNKNKKETEREEMQFFNRGLEYFLKLERNLPPAELKNTAISWRGIRILIRNALISAANEQREEYLYLVKEKLSDNSPIIRYYAARALIKINYKKSQDLIAEYLNTENKKYRDKIKNILKLEEESNGY